jgi:hypothetical protein
MDPSSVREQEELSPEPATLVGGMRDIGYSFKTAVADIIDNSIAAGAKRIDVWANFAHEEPHVAFFDDGVGMTLEVLREAMRPGTRGPLAIRNATDLGRFGLGLKTASFSQCRRLTVASTSSVGPPCARSWDIDHVILMNKWLLDVPQGPLFDQLTSQLGSHGTLVLWQKLDRLQHHDSDASNRAIDEMRSHLALVFHRFLLRRDKRIVMSVNGLAIDPIDPFCEGHPATLAHEQHVLSFPSGSVVVRGFTIPHHAKMTTDEYKRVGLDGGHFRNQGFYIYRRDRLIMHGGWLGLVRPSSTLQLSRVRVDVPAELDSDWRVDIKKSSTQLPSNVRTELSKVIARLGIGSERTYQYKGRIMPIQAQWGLWCRLDKGESITYNVNAEHPAIHRVREALDPDCKKFLDQALALVAASLPLDTIFNDQGQRPTDIRLPPLDDDALRAAVEDVASKLSSQGMTIDEILSLLLALPQFAERQDRVTEILHIRKGNSE